ncbi:PP2C family protein-serine/threonine phosphatase [Streptomyces vilmorinianum]|uniref:PP2C family protein-serine/threonine phosphatase n=1 Tax=Streptomyces vilmorinianum TaxID=3051092 RepID=UPI0020C7D4B2|nr:PP2C family protein-serine/threonine phosphatase [Streptomyces vilmorinianum]
MSERAGAQASLVEEHAAVLARLRAATDAIGEIGAHLDETAVCEDLAAFLCRHGYEAAAVDVRPEEGATWVRAAMAGDPKLVDRLEPRPHAGAARTYADVAPGGVAVRVLTVPLEWRDRVVGSVSAVSARTGGFTDHETAMVHDAARLAAVHLGHARRLAATERTAFHLQQALVAEPGRPHPNLEIAGRYLPAGARTLVGGDWFETVRLHFGRSLLVVGDVMGHGLDAAVDMNAYRSALRDVASTDLPPHRVLRQLDSVVADDGGMRPATCLLAQVDPARRVATFASAGHLPPVIVAADGSADLVELPVGPPLGTGVGGYEPVNRTLAPSDTLVLFTDGLVERRGEDIDVSLARLSTLRLRAGSGPEEVVEEVLERLDARHAEDDVAVLAARLRERPAP